MNLYKLAEDLGVKFVDNINYEQPYRYVLVKPGFVGWEIVRQKGEHLNKMQMAIALSHIIMNDPCSISFKDEIKYPWLVSELIFPLSALKKYAMSSAVRIADIAKQWEITEELVDMKLRYLKNISTKELWAHRLENIW